MRGVAHGLDNLYEELILTSVEERVRENGIHFIRKSRSRVGRHSGSESV